jgi:hypothetical protein
MTVSIIRLMQRMHYLAAAAQGMLQQGQLDTRTPMWACRTLLFGSSTRHSSGSSGSSSSSFVKLLMMVVVVVVQPAGSA